MKRKKYLDELSANAENIAHLNVVERERRKSVRINAADLFWTRQAEEGASEHVGLAIIKAAKSAQDDLQVTGRNNKMD